MDNKILLNEAKGRLCLLKSELEKVFDSLHHYGDVVEVNSIKVGVYKHIKKLLPCFDVLLIVSELNSLQSLITLLRMIVDNYAILYLFTCHSNNEEKLLRYYLYLLDALKTRSTILKNSISEISEESKLYEEQVIKADDKEIEKIEKIILENKLNQLVVDKIITTHNWKYKNIGNNEKYKWFELYEVVKIPTHDVDVIQNYCSSFVHGLGLSLMLKDSDDITPHIYYSLEICTIIQSLILKILMKEFSEETNLMQINKKAIEYSNTMGWVL